MRAGLSILARVLVVWLITAGTLMLLSALLAGFDVEDFAVALAAAAAIGLINALIWPLVIRVALPFTVLTLGLGVLVLNGAVVWVVSEIEPGMTVESLGVGVVVAFGLTVVNTAGHLAARHRRRRLLVPQRGQAPGQAAAGRRATSPFPASTSSRSTGWPTTCSGAPSGTATRRTSPAGCTTAATACWAGRRTGRPRPAPARPACCTATTTTCRRFAGGRRTAGRRS